MPRVYPGEPAFDAHFRMIQGRVFLTDPDLGDTEAACRHCGRPYDRRTVCSVSANGKRGFKRCPRCNTARKRRQDRSKNPYRRDSWQRYGHPWQTECEIRAARAELP